MATVGQLVNWLNLQFTDDSGVPLAGGFLEFFVSGEVTHKDTFSTADLDPSGVNSNPLELDSSGRPAVAIFLEPGLYDATIKDANSVLIKSVEGFGTPAAETPTGLGRSLSQGARQVTSGYTAVDADNFVTVNEGSTEPCIFNLPSSALRQQQLAIQNYGPTSVKVTPTGGDTINGQAFYTINANVATNFPGIVLLPDVETVGNWLVLSSHTS